MSEPVRTGRFDDVHAREAGVWTVRDPQQHGRSVQAMFARIAGVYDFMNHFLSAGRDRAWRKRVAARIDHDAWEILDLCAGTGDLALACRAAGRGRAWLAADFCAEMLRGSRGKKGADELELLAADALALPLRDHSVDVVTVGFGVRNFADVRGGLGEIARVLRPGGQLVVLEFFRDDPRAHGELRGVVAPIRFPGRQFGAAARPPGGPRQGGVCVPAGEHGPVPDRARVPRPAGRIWLQRCRGGTADFRDRAYRGGPAAVNSACTA
ncbi:MAG: class I SAM-dependent methyltransferase [bacterium]|nr:class I SAM-dependent methyltransferase [bacterium]